jgi:MbtH protein
VTSSFDDDVRNYVVLVNEEGQYSLWLASNRIPLGWTVTGPSGKRSECLDWIGKVWTDMRPKSLARGMAKAAGE